MGGQQPSAGTQSTSGAPMLQVTNVSKRFANGTLALAGVSLDAAAGEIVCLLGPSGCGKTTLLRIIAGLERADQGSVACEGADLSALPTYRRRFGFMFQDYALFPHLTVGQNIAFGLRMAGAAPAQIQARVAAMLELVNLTGYGQRSVDALSGGEQQRIALARTLAPAPRLLLLDEPLANLDRLLREELAEELRAILKRVGVTTIFVTHDQQEAFALADRILVLNQGRVEQAGPPAGVYAEPANSFVAAFLGLSNLLPVEGSEVTTGQVLTALGSFTLPPAAVARHQGRPTRLLIRPEAASISGAPSALAGAVALAPTVVGAVTSCTFRGQFTRVAVQPVAAPTLTLTFLIETQRIPHPLAVGEEVTLAIDVDKILLTPEQSALD